jgi:hypothetical protein
MKISDILNSRMILPEVREREQTDGGPPVNAYPLTVARWALVFNLTPYIMDMISTIVVILARMGGVQETLMDRLDDFNLTSSTPEHRSSKKIALLYHNLRTECQCRYHILWSFQTYRN